MSRSISCSSNSSDCTKINHEMASLRLVCRRRTSRNRLRPFPVQKLVHMLNIQFGVLEEMTVARTCILDVMRTRQLMRKNPRVLSRKMTNFRLAQTTDNQLRAAPKYSRKSIFIRKTRVFCSHLVSSLRPTRHSKMLLSMCLIQ